MARQPLFAVYGCARLDSLERRAPGVTAAYFSARPGDEPGQAVLRLLAEQEPEVGQGLLDPAAAGELQLELPSRYFPPRVASGATPEHPGDAALVPAVSGATGIVLSARSRSERAAARAREVLERSGDFQVGVDLPFDAVDHGAAVPAVTQPFGTRSDAEALLRSDRLAREDLRGRGVNLVVVDRGLDAEALRDDLGGNFAGGWSYCPEGPGSCLEPGELTQVRGVTDNGHGMMVARNVVALAPGAWLHDLPLLPARIASLPRFLSHAHAAFERVLADVRASRRNEPQGRWILVNAWAIFDRSGERPPGDYSGNPLHPFNLLVSELERSGIDLVFAAGNCGQLGPDPRCGRYDIGPGCSLHGANAHPAVLSVGAVRSDGLWLGSSSQGPGPAGFGREKPDVVAPSLFSEDGDRATRNGGSSAACALAGGLLAALREGWSPTAVSPDALRQCLRRSARRAGAPGWDPRLGWGVLDAEAAVEALARLSPRAPA